MKTEKFVGRGSTLDGSVKIVSTEAGQAIKKPRRFFTKDTCVRSLIIGLALNGLGALAAIIALILIVGARIMGN
jgi:hypothetical protein